MNVLSLCSGIGGLDYGLSQAISNYRTICYVEFEPFCQEILLARMADGLLDLAPIWGDLRAFDGRPWRGVVDGVASGFPCQPFSTAGKRKGEEDARNLWPEVRRVIVESQPAVVILENVPGSLPYFYHVVLPELSGMGYAAQARLVTAAEVGAPHRRQRLFVLAVRELARWPTTRIGRLLDPGRQSQTRGGDLADSQGERLERRRDGSARITTEGSGFLSARSGELPPWPPGPTERDRWANILARWPELAPAVADAQQSNVHQAATSQADGAGGTASACRGSCDDGQSEIAPESPFRRVAHGLPHRIHRLKALGNAVVPAQVAEAIRLLLTEAHLAP